jgi:hypothetical protein
MEIEWIGNKEKNEMYRSALDYCQLHGLTEDNCVVATLLLSPGDFSDVYEVQNYVSRFTDGGHILAFASIEPVIPGNDLNTMKLLKMYGNIKTELLPFFHVHMVILDKNLNLSELRLKWASIVGSNNKKLFHISPIEKTMRDVVNYVTKFFESGRGRCGMLGFINPGEVIESKDINEERLIPTPLLHKVVKVIQTCIRKWNRVPDFFRVEFGLPITYKKKSTRSP